MADEQYNPFYKQNHNIGAAIAFELSEPTMLRVSGSMLHDPFVDPALGGVVLLNGMDFEIFGGDDYIGAFASFQPVVQFDQETMFPAGSYSLILSNFSTSVGDLDSGLIGVNSAWDITVEVVPTPASILALPLGMVLASRRRR